MKREGNTEGREEFFFSLPLLRTLDIFQQRDVWAHGRTFPIFMCKVSVGEFVC